MVPHLQHAFQRVSAALSPSALSVVVAIALTFPGATASRAAEVEPSSRLDLSRRDHRVHVGVSFGLAFMGGQLLREAGVPAAPLCAGLLVLAAGSLKEALDKNPSGGDFQANAVGAAGGALAAFVIRF